MNAWFLGLVFTIPVLLTVAWFFACDPIQAARVDQCLDRGGSYNDEAQECDFQQN